jgi:putative effector of murein hydrolase LrgA (UPF0299 family)
MDWLYFFITLLLFGLVLGVMPYHKSFHTNNVTIVIVFFFAWIIACYVFAKRNQKKGPQYGLHSIGGSRSFM